MMVFTTQLCELLPLSSSLWFNSPPFPVWNSILYTHILCVRGGYEVLGLRQINTCRKVPLQVNFALLFMSLIFYVVSQQCSLQYLIFFKWRLSLNITFKLFPPPASPTRSYNKNARLHKLKVISGQILLLLSRFFRWKILPGRGNTSTGESLKYSWQWCDQKTRFRECKFALDCSGMCLINYSMIQSITFFFQKFSFSNYFAC